MMMVTTIMIIARSHIHDDSDDSEDDYSDDDDNLDNKWQNVRCRRSVMIIPNCLRRGQ